MAEIASFGVNVDQNTKLAQNAQDTANDANKKNSANSQQIANINDPNYLTPFEKPQLEIQMDNFATIYKTDKDIATAEGIDFTAYDAAYQAYLAYMTPLIADITTYSPIVRTTFNSLVVAVQNAQKAFNTATQAQYTQAMDKAKADIANNQSSYAAMQQAVADMKTNANSVATIASAAISSAGFANDTASSASQAAGDARTIASQAANNVAIAKNDASDAVATANSTASEFGKVDQKADSAVASALNAQSEASDAVKQASSAATDSKDAKQIAGAVSQSYKTLTDGSTMTIAELQSGLAVKLTKTDLDGYATETWAQNQINTTADGINGTISSIKNTVDGQKTDINDLKADSNSFKAQFTTVNDTLGKHTTDIGNLQVSSKELTSGFNTLTTDNTTNKNDISELKQTAKGFSSTLETVQTQVKNSAVGTNLLKGTSNTQDYTVSGSRWAVGSQSNNGTNVSIPCTPGASYTYSAIVKSTTYDCYPEIIFLNSSKNYILYSVNAPGKDTGMRKTTAVAPENATFVIAHMVLNNPSDSQTMVFNSEKLEKGSLATDWCPNPADTATVTALTKVKQTVDGMESDISKKIEQKDLNGYATETWAQNKINATADGINATVSSVKHTVNSHTTDINNLQADSRGFKAQFDTVNDTLGKQTTDIGNLQATSKELTSGFNTLTSDNTTNKNDISQLKQTATEVSSTLETVQTQVNNSAVGTNLYTDTQNFDNLESWWGSSHWTKITDNYKELAVLQTTDPWNGLSQYIQVKKGDVLTYSVYAKYTSGTGKSTIYWSLNQSTEGDYSSATSNPSNSVITITDSWQRVSGTTVATSDGYLRPRLERDSQNTNTLQIAGIKVEKGSVATDWCLNPADNATVTALTKVKQTADGAQALATNNHGDITNLQATAKGIQTTVSNNYSDLKSQNTQTAGLVQTLVSKSPSNIIKDGGFNSATVGQVPSGWALYSFGQIVANPDTVSNLVATGRSVLQINSRTSGNSDIYYGDWFDVQPGDQFYAELKARWSSMSQKGRIILGVVTKNAAGRWTWTSGAITSSPSNWAKYTGVLTIPAGAVQGRVWVSWQDCSAANESVQVTDLVVRPAYATQADMTVLSNDINLRVKKGDVANQFNIDAGGALLQTVGGNTKIVLSAPNVIVDSANPMQIQNANIVGTLTGKTFEAGTITATTKIIGSDIEAALVHSKDNSFSLNGATGDIVGASIHAADNSWGISNAGKIHGTSITASVMDISGDGKGPNFDAVNVTPDTTQGIYSRYKYSVNSGYDVSKFGRKLYKNGYLVINGDTFLNRTIGDWSADGGGKYVYDTMYEAHTIKMRAYNYTGSNVQTDDPSSTQGSISSRLDIQPSAISMGRDWSVGNPNILIDGDGLLKVGSIAINDHHSMGTTDGSGMYFMKMNKNATNVSGTSIPIHAARYYTANMGISGGHVINSYDGHDVYLEDKWGSGGNMVSLHVKKLYNSSLLSLKTDITTIDPNDALETIANTDFRSYRFKTDDPSEPKSVSPILDDINPIPKYNTPDIFKSADGKSRNDGNILGYTALSVQALYAKIKDLTARLQKLEGAN